MLKRRVYNDLLEFKTNHENKCLIIDGARQIGKSYIVENIFSKEYDSFLKIDFLEKESNKAIFDGDIDNDSIIQKIKLYYPNFDLIKGNTLLFLDELQECPKAIVALKYLAMNNDVDVVCSGSSLGLAYKANISYPVGYVKTINMYSLDFEEFLWALGVENELIENMRSLFNNPNLKKIDDAIFNKMNEYLKQYLVVGGMPEAVNKFIETNDYKQTYNVLKRIYHDYVTHIATYADPDIKIKTQAAYKTITGQLSKENHKFQYSFIEKKGTARKFESSVDWLVNSKIVNKVNNVSSISYPLESFDLNNNFRLYHSDIGLLISTYDFSIVNSLLNDSFDEQNSNPIIKSAKGGIYEALAADLLFKKDINDIHFYRNEAGTIEIEFLIENNKYGIIPIEIKAGRGQSKSLTQILKNNDIKIGYKFSNQKNGKVDKKITLPLFMIMFI